MQSVFVWRETEKLDAFTWAYIKQQQYSAAYNSMVIILSCFEIKSLFWAAVKNWVWT